MTLNIVSHKTVLIKILKDIYANSDTGPVLGFKGGTAASFFYGLDRFSVDLDFDLLDARKEDVVFEQVNNILSKYGELKESRKKRFNLFYVLSYMGKDVNAQNVKVDINRREFGSRYHVESFLGISMQVMVKEDMAAHKLCAMYERIGKTNRDIYDVQFFLARDFPVNKKIVEQRMGMPYKEFLTKCIAKLENLVDWDILFGTGELLNEKQKNWVKQKLKEETIFYLKLSLDQEG